MPRDSRGRWLPGRSPNPGGRPKGRTLRAEIEAKLAERPNKGSRTTRLERMAQMLVSKAEAGDMRAVELILKRLWPEKLAIQGEPVTLLLRDFTGIEHEVHRQLPADAVVEVEDVRIGGALLPETIGRAPAADAPAEKPEPVQAEVKPETETWSIRRPWEDERPSHAETDE